MGVFVSFYYQTFVRVASIGVLGLILKELSSEEQL